MENTTYQRKWLHIGEVIGGSVAPQGKKLINDKPISARLSYVSSGSSFLNGFSRRFLRFPYSDIFFKTFGSNSKLIHGGSKSRVI